jgi:serine/threonine-protein kinase
MSREAERDGRPRLADLLLDLERRWAASAPGRRPGAADYRDRLRGPEAANWAAALIWKERELRRDAGEEVPTEHYLDEFSDIRELLELYFGVERELAEAAPAAEGVALRGAPVGGLWVDGYELQCELNRGGMGTIWKARDPELRRYLALKVLHAEHLGAPARVRRFEEEAQVTAQLQHPGIPWVYRRGKLPTGQPYFAMKLVEGRTLEALRRDRRASPPEHLGLLHVFEQVCQTLAYAHSRGVIHRDLKPANIMVGPFGEVQVLDWGLAKALAGVPHRPALLTPRPPLPSVGEGELLPPPSPSVGQGWGEGGPPLGEGTAADLPEHTEPGCVLGTLKYMPPEQAAGRVDELDERCDVFSLGAILCELLTGLGPYAGLGRDEVVRLARQGDLQPRLGPLRGCGADAELVGLALRCLAVRPADRPRDAAAVARAVAAYLANVQERKRKAELERAEAEARAHAEAQARLAADARARAERRARRRAAGLAASLLLTLLLGSGSLAWWWQQRQEKARAGSAALDCVDAWLRQGKYPEARAKLDLAEAVLGVGAPEHLHRRKEQLLADLALAARLEEALLGRQLRGTAPTAGTLAGRAYAQAFQEHFHLDVFAADAGAVAQRLARSAIRPLLLAALDDWALAERDLRRAHLLEVARRAAPGDWGNRFRAPALRRDRQALRRLAEGADVASLPPATLVALAATLQAAGEAPDPLLARACKAHLGDFWVHFAFANCLASKLPAPPAGPWGVGAPEWQGLRGRQQARANQAVAHYKVALLARPRCAVAYHNLGVVLRALRRADEALTAFHKALEHSQGGGGTAPAAWSCHAQLGALLREQGQPDEAAGHRFQAACAAAQAGCGHGACAALPEAERVRWRRRALDWLRAEVKRLAELPEGWGAARREAVCQGLGQMKSAAALADLREREALEKLPGDERLDWQKLWAEVDELLGRARGGP